MTIENLNKAPEKSLAEEQKMSLFAERLAPYADLQSQEDWVKDCTRDIVVLKGGDTRVENFFQNIEKNQHAQLMIRNNPEYFFMILYGLSEEKFNNPEDIEVVLHNMKERVDEVSTNRSERRKRIISNPYATDEEYRLGVYKESLESQVRDAVFTLLEKGYMPIESGFDHATQGSQYIGIEKISKIEHLKIFTDSNEKNFPEQMALVKRHISKIQFKVLDDCIQIILIPRDRILSLKTWKLVLDNVAYLLPDLSKSEVNNTHSSNGIQGTDFRDVQDDIKKGENTWLNDDLAFVDGKVTEMSYKDFVELGSK